MSKPILRVLVVILPALLLLILVGWFVSPRSAGASVMAITRYVATTGNDSGNCSSPSNPCATIQYAHDQSTAGDTVQIAAGTYMGGVILDRSITLQGTDATTTIIDGNDAQSAVQLYDAASSLTIRKLTIRNGGAYGISSGATTLIEESIIRDNQPPAGNHGSGVRVWGPTTIRHTRIYANSGLYGGGINASGPLTVTHSAIYSNTVAQQGGGIYLGNNAVAWIENSTISNNQSDFNGGGIYLGAPGAQLTLRNVTLTANAAGLSNTAGGISNANGTTITLYQSIIANNIGAHQCTQFNGTWQSLGYNIGSDSTCHLTASGDQPNTNPVLAPLADNGGNTLTHALAAGSPAIDTGSAADCPVTDQRGRLRPYDGNGDSTAACDIGAFESGSTDTPPPPQSTRYVATTGDDSGNDCLNQASPCATIQHAINQAFSGETVQIAVGTYTENLSIDKDLTLQGADAATTIVDGNQMGRVIQMTFSPAHDVTLRNLSLHNGKGGILSSSGALVVENCRIYNNNASGEFYDDGGGLYLWGPTTIRHSNIYSNTGQYGGGIYATQPLTVTGSAIYANTAAIEGGGVSAAINGGGEVTIQNSTISGNQAVSYGGGIVVDAPGTHLLLRHVTVAYNQIGATNSTAGVFAGSASVTLRNSLIADNTGGQQCNDDTAAFTSDGNNLSSDHSCGLTQPGDLPNAKLRLGSLKDNGGATMTHALLQGSPAVDAANSAHCLAEDQRGEQRPFGSACDIGAYEANGTEPPPDSNHVIYLPLIIR